MARTNALEVFYNLFSAAFAHYKLIEGEVGVQDHLDLLQVNSTLYYKFSIHFLPVGANHPSKGLHCYYKQL